MASPLRSSLRWADDDCLVADLRHLSWARIGAAVPRGYPPSRYPGLYQIDYVVRGQLDVWIGDEVLEVGGGNVVVFRPGEWHGGVGSVLHPGELFCLMVRLPVRGVARGEARELARAFAGLERRVVPANAAVDECFRGLVAEHRERTPLSTTAARAALHRLLVEIARQAQRPAPSPAPRIAEAMRWIDANLATIRSVEDVARAVRSRGRQFRAAFGAALGATPKAWLLQRRVARAKRLLAGSRDSVLSIALDVGFASSQHLATTFKRLTGLTPLAYRRLATPGRR